MRPDASAASGGHDHTCDVRAAQAGEAEAAQGQVCACQLGGKLDRSSGTGCGAIWGPAFRAARPLGSCHFYTTTQSLELTLNFILSELRNPNFSSFLFVA